MIQILKYPSKSDWKQLCERAKMQGEELSEIVSNIMSDVKLHGDDALRRYALKFDGAKLDSLEVTADEIRQAEAQVPAALKDAISVAVANITKFHSAQAMPMLEVETMPGVKCWQKSVPIERVGLYVPGGNAPLFSTVLMLALPARIAGCREIVLATPPERSGRIHPAILYAAHVAGVDKIIKTGGAQAIAAMAFGTETVPYVDKIFGPGNRFVTEAKKQVSALGVAIDMPAGPSEVMIMADGEANVDYVASDFLSQAEHGPDSQSILVTCSESLAESLPSALNSAMEQLPDDAMIRKSLAHSCAIVMSSVDEVWDFANMYAPEHLIVNTKNPQEAFTKVYNAGSVFLGEYSPESVGDYASGTNHTLPTGGYATSRNGVNLDSFVKKITFQQLSREGITGLASTVITMAENEHLYAHAHAVKVRISEK